MSAAAGTSTATPSCEGEELVRCTPSFSGCPPS